MRTWVQKRSEQFVRKAQELLASVLYTCFSKFNKLEVNEMFNVRFLSVMCIWAILALAVSGGAFAMTMADIPPELLPDWFASADPDSVAFEYTDYTAINGLVGEYTNLEKGPTSLFNDADSGITGLPAGAQWVSGEGIKLYNDGDQVIYRWKNIRVNTNVKHFSQRVRVTGGMPDLDHIVAWTDSGDDQLTITDKQYSAVTGMLRIDVLVKPQPNEVNIRIPFLVNSPAVIDMGWVLDQCRPIPEPSAVTVLAGGLISLIAVRRRRA